MGWLLFALQVLFWSPMIYRVATRKTPETTIWDELGSSLRVPGLVMYELGLALIWGGLLWRAWTQGIGQSVTTPVAIGIILHVIAIILMFWAFTVHRSWNVQPRLEPDHHLCTIGPYGWIRHPIYLAFDLLGIGCSVWVPSIAVVIGTLLLVLGGDLRARAEERVLMQTFGDEYRNYMRRVSRALPKIY